MGGKENEARRRTINICVGLMTREKMNKQQSQKKEKGSGREKGIMATLF